MTTKTIAWATGTGSFTISYSGSGNGTAVITSSDNNLYQARSQQITFQTTEGSPQITKTVTITQAARVKTDISAAVVTAADQTYNGSAFTPTPTVVLNGTTIPSSGYDVAYSDNTNAGSATITVTGKGDYTGTATGTFTIAQATGQVTTAPTARSVTYSGSAQYLVTAGSGTGTMQYRYKLSTSSTWSSWSTTRARSTNAGTYNVQYRAAASSDGNYTVSAVGELNVTIAKASRTIAFTTAPTSVEIGATITVVATPSAGASDGTITYASSDTSKATVSGNVVTGVALGACTISATISGGSNYNDATTSYSLGVTEVNYANQYLTIESLEDGNEIRFRCSTYGTSYLRTIYWSTNKQTWTSVQSTGGSGCVITTLNAGEKIYLKGENNTYGFSSETNMIGSSKSYNVYGNIMSLIYGEDFVGETSLTTNYAFKAFFRPNSSLPGKIVSSENLVLPATELTTYCYYEMFREQTLITIAPELPATTLKNYCYGNMFYGCSALRYIKCLATDRSATNCTSNWVRNVPGLGTFVKNSDATWSVSASGIPTGYWTVINHTDKIQPIEYLQSSGTQYIDLAVFGTEKHGIEMKFQYHSTSSTSGTGRLFGTKTGSNATGAFGYVNTTTGTTASTAKFYLGSNGGLSNTIAIDTDVHVVKMNKDNDKKVYLDSTLAVTGDSNTFTNTAEASLFRCNSSGTWYAGGVGRVYYLKIYNESTLIMDLIPVRVGTVGYMYNRLTRALYPNFGTGSFTLGADI